MYSQTKSQRCLSHLSQRRRPVAEEPKQRRHEPSQRRQSLQPSLHLRWTPGAFDADGVYEIWCGIMPDGAFTASSGVIRLGRFCEGGCSVLFGRLPTQPGQTVLDVALPLTVSPTQKGASWSPGAAGRSCKPRPQQRPTPCQQSLLGHWEGCSHASRLVWHRGRGVLPSWKICKQVSFHKGHSIKHAPPGVSGARKGSS